MQIKIKQIQDIVSEILLNKGFSEEEVKYIIENCTDAELSGKQTHGFVRVMMLSKYIEAGKIKVGKQTKEISVEKETPISLLVNGQQRTGLYVVNKTLEMALEKVKDSGMVAAGVTNTAPMSSPEKREPLAEVS
jgi:LDH2 family malate/lactate/ureidoglycolate dehydrogenase